MYVCMYVLTISERLLEMLLFGGGGGNMSNVSGCGLAGRSGGPVSETLPPPPRSLVSSAASIEPRSLVLPSEKTSITHTDTIRNIQNRCHNLYKTTSIIIILLKLLLSQQHAYCTLIFAL